MLLKVAEHFFAGSDCCRRLPQRVRDVVMGKKKYNYDVVFHTHGDMRQCKFCIFSMLHNATRLNKHVQKCSHIPDKEKRLFAGKNYRPVDKPQAVRDADVSSSALASVMSEGPAAPLTKSMVSLTPAQVLLLKRDIGMMIYTSCSPFSLVENQHFKNLLTHAGISSCQVTRKEIAGKILDEMFERAQDARDREMSSSASVVLSIDCATKINHLAALNTMALLPAPVLLDSEEIRGENKNTGFYVKKYEAMIQRVGIQKVSGLVNDGEAVMLAALRTLHSKYPHIVVVRCIAHLVSLFVKEDLSQITSLHHLVNQVKEVSNAIHNSSHLTGIFKNEMESVAGSVYPSVPGESLTS